MNKIIEIVRNAIFKKQVSTLSIVFNTSFEPHSNISRFAKVSNSRIGDYSDIGPNSIINNTTVGRYCSFAMNVKSGLGVHPLDRISTAQLFYSTNNPFGITIGQNNKFIEYYDVVIGNDVWIGANVIVKDGVKIGHGAIIGANTTVVKDVGPYEIVGGTPGKLIKKRFNDDIISKLIESKWWNLDHSSFATDKELMRLFNESITISNIQLIIDRINQNSINKDHE